MKKIIKQLILILPLLFAETSMKAQATIDIATLTDKMKIYDSYYTVGSSQTDYSGAYVFTGTSTNTYYIKINSGGYTDTTFTFKDVTMNSGTGDGGLLFMDTKITMNLIGSNHIESKRGIYQKTDTLSLSGDSLTVVANNSSYPGMGPTTSSGNIIFIKNKYLYAQTTSTSYPAIGGNSSYCDSIKINGTTVTAISEGSCNLQANYICINGGSVKGSLSQTAVNSEGESVYCVTVPHNGQLSIEMNDGTKDSTLTFYAHHPDDDNFYIYLPNGSYSFTNGDGATYTATVEGADAVASVPAVVGNGIIDVSPGEAVNVYDTVYYIGAQPYTYKGHTFTFTGTTTTGGVTIYSKIADTIILQNLNIGMENGRAFSLQTGTDIALILEGTNTLESTGLYAGLEKDSTAGTLSVCGPDTLIATGYVATGVLSGGTGIGGNGYTDAVSCGNINISGGVIQANGFYAIGGNNSNAGDITINGGKITAIGYYGAIKKAANISINGGSVSLNCTNGSVLSATNSVCINGGIIEAISTNGPTLPAGITITGGTIFVQVNCTPDYYVSTSTYGFAFISGKFTGGTVNMLAEDGETVSIYSYYPDNNDYTHLIQVDHPVNTDSTIMYRQMYQVPGITEPTAVDTIIINGSGWGSTDVYTDSTGILYLWAPVAENTETSITVGGVTYTYSGETIAYDNYVAPDEEEGIVEYGNYLWMVPVSIETEGSGSVAVSSSGITLANGDYFCYKTDLPLTVSASPAEGYILDSLTVYGEETDGDTTVTVADTIKIAAIFKLNTGLGEITSISATVYTGDQKIFVKTEAGLQVTVYTTSGVLLSTALSDGATLAFPVDASGLYLVQIAGAEGTVVKKCVVK